MKLLVGAAYSQWIPRVYLLYKVYYCIAKTVNRGDILNMFFCIRRPTTCFIYWRPVKYSICWPEWGISCYSFVLFLQFFFLDSLFMFIVVMAGLWLWPHSVSRWFLATARRFDLPATVPKLCFYLVCKIKAFSFDLYHLVKFLSWTKDLLQERDP